MQTINTETKTALQDFDLEQLDSYETTVYNDLRERMTKENALQILINSVEGDYTQLSEGLREIAENN